MTTQESYVKLIVNSDGKVQPELFISGEPKNEDVAQRLKDLIQVLESDKFNFKVAKDEVSHEVKQMSGWKQITVRGSDKDKVVKTFVELSNENTFATEVE